VPSIYKILPREDWDAAQAAGAFAGAGVDLTDGFIHFSTAETAQDTARLHFPGRANLVLLRIDSEALGAALKWEPSRGGTLFPHLYGQLDCKLVLDARALALGDDGVPALGALAP
jgi:uncharacterized protein (DUF952 family)